MFGSLIRRKSGQRRWASDDAAFESTTFSLSTAVPRPAERRDDERMSADAARRQADDAAGERAADPDQNLSAGGLMAIVGHAADGRRAGRDRAVVAEDPVDRGLDPRRTWSGSSSTRMSTSASCSPGASRATASARARRASRSPARRRSSVGKVYYTVDVHDISLGGMKVEPIEEYCVGKKVVVVVESLRPIKGEVRWYSDRKRRHRVRPAARVRRARRMGRQAARTGQPQGVLPKA